MLFPILLLLVVLIIAGSAPLRKSLQQKSHPMDGLLLADD
jgi:hypothetical protein